MLTLYAATGGRDIVGDTKSLFTALFGPRTPRTKFKKQLKRNSAIGEQDLLIWEEAYAVAKTTPLTVNLPHRELLHLDNQLVLSAQALRFRLPPGRELYVRALDNSPNLFGELFSLQSGEAAGRPLTYFSAENRELRYETSQLYGEELLLALQTAPWQFTRYELQITTSPVLAFPVVGKDEGAFRVSGAPLGMGENVSMKATIFLQLKAPICAPLFPEKSRA
ncbi:MAG: hypothetical protein AAF840_05580 [Bacteroidota bacterium]